MKLTIRPHTPDLWPALQDLFGKRGACNGCWCMYWRIGSVYRKKSRDANKKAFRKIVDSGPPPGVFLHSMVKSPSRVTSALTRAALKAATQAKAPALEAYPLDATKTPSASGTGYVTTFARAGRIDMSSQELPRGNHGRA